MTPPRTPDDEPGHERPDGRPADSGVVPPPPPNWGETQDFPKPHLLPEPPRQSQDDDDPEDLPEDDPEDLPRDDPEDDPEDEPQDDPEGEFEAELNAERTITDLNLGSDTNTQVLPRGNRAATPPPPPAETPAEEGSGFRPDVTITDPAAFWSETPGQPGESAKQTREEPRPMAAPTPTTSDEYPTRVEEPDEYATRVEQPGEYATRVEQPDEQQAAAYQQPPPPSPAHEPFPYAQQIPAPPQPPAPRQAPAPKAPPEPFPYAQEIPRPPPSEPPSFPYAHGAPAQSSPPEPFPFAQEIPGPPPASPEPFPFAQEIPSGHAPTAPYAAPHEAPAPSRPAPPPIEEPWRVQPPPGGKAKKAKKPKREKRSGGGAKRSKKPLLIGAGAVVAVGLLVAGGMVLLPLGGGDEDDAGGGAQLAGSLFAPNAAVRTDGRDQTITGVAGADSTVVAVGGETDADVGRGIFLVSDDGGRTFTTAKTRDASGEGAAPSEVPQAVGGSEDGWVAIGTRPGGGAVWTSKDGRTWLREPDAVGDVFGAHTRVKRIVSTGSGFVAMGDVTAKGDFSDAQPAVWTSGDGRRWEPRSGAQIGLEVEKGKLELTEAAVSGRTVLLEGLHTPGGGKAAYRRVWSSDDGGRTWSGSMVPVPKGSRGLQIGGGPGGFVAVRELAGRQSYGQAFVSKDGQSWSKAGRIQPSGYRRVERIVGDGTGFAALVVRGRDLLVSRSADGRTWADAGSLPVRPGMTAEDAALAGGQAVVVGQQHGGGDMNALLNVWDKSGRAVPSDLTKTPGVLRTDQVVAGIGAASGKAVAVGSAGGDAAVWSSQDGAAWQPAQGLGAAFTRPGPQRLLDAVSGKSGWLAVGYDQTAPRRPLVVTSVDGASWQAVDGLPAFRGSTRSQPATAAAAAGPAGYVIVGTDGPTAAAWTASDLKGWTRAASADRQALEARAGASSWLLDVTAGSAGYIAAGGTRQARDGGAAGNRPGIWTSADGKSWTLKELPLPSGGEVTEGHLTHVAAKGGTVVAAGVAATSRGLGWLGYVSTDGGANWKPITVPGDDPKVTVTSLAATPKGFAATGTTGRQGAADVVSFTSADGSTWASATPGGTGLGGPGGQQITGFATLGDKLLGVGRDIGAQSDQPVLWSRPVP